MATILSPKRQNRHLSTYEKVFVWWPRYVVNLKWYAWLETLLKKTDYYGDGIKVVTYWKVK